MKPFLIYMTLHPIPSEFPCTRGNFPHFFLSVDSTIQIMKSYLKRTPSCLHCKKGWRQSLPKCPMEKTKLFYHFHLLQPWKKIRTHLSSYPNTIFFWLPSKIRRHVTGSQNHNCTRDILNNIASTIQFLWRTYTVEEDWHCSLYTNPCCLPYDDIYSSFLIFNFSKSPPPPHH